MNNLAAAAFGCVAALALWKGTKERWFPTLLGMFIIVVAVKWADKTDSPWTTQLFGQELQFLWPGLMA
jgi:hypothetical protein